MGNMDFYYKELNTKNVEVCGIYKYTNERFNDLEQIDNYKELTVKFSESKIKFLELDTTIQKSPIVMCFSNALFWEIKFNKDMALWILDDFKQFISDLIDRKILKTVPLYFAYFSVMAQYTEWAYNNMYRKDYYTTSDLTNLYSIQEAVTNTSDILTLKEMISIAEACERYDSKISLIAMTEGLKSNELVELKKEQFENVNNHEITLHNGRKFKMSDRLYNLCHKYSFEDTATTRYRGNKIVEAKLKDCEYLLRSTSRKNTRDKMLPSQLATIIRNDLGLLNVRVESRIFRTYSMMYDLTQGMSMEQINKKYNTKYTYPINIYRDQNVYDKMIAKVESEKQDR